MVKKLIKNYNVYSTNTVLDIGCNDGILLNHYPKNFSNVIGVEPSDASKHIKQKRIKLIGSFFNYKTSKKYLEKYAKPKIITITNVLAQIDNLNEFSKRRIFAFERLNSMKSISCVNAQGAFYLFPKISSVGMKSAQFCDELLSEAKVAAVPGIAFGADDYIRISYATSMENLEKGLARMEDFVESL